MPRALEENDELGLPWDDWADGRVQRLIRGRDFFRAPEAVREAAENAAKRMNRVARTVVESRARKLYVWIQFADYEVPLGGLCPGCGSADLRRINRQHTECASCKATVIIVIPRRERGVDEHSRPLEKGEELLQLLLGPTGGPKAVSVARRQRATGGDDGPDARVAPSRQRARDVTPAGLEDEPLRLRTEKRFFNEHAAIHSATVASKKGEPLKSIAVDEECLVMTAVEVATANAELRCGLVLQVDGIGRFRATQPKPFTTSKPGSFVVTVRIPPNVLDAAIYTGRVGAIVTTTGEESRIVRLNAFTFHAYDPREDDDGDAELGAESSTGSRGKRLRGGPEIVDFDAGWSVKPADRKRGVLRPKRRRRK